MRKHGPEAGSVIKMDSGTNYFNCKLTGTFKDRSVFGPDCLDTKNTQTFDVKNIKKYYRC